MNRILFFTILLIFFYCITCLYRLDELYTFSFDQYRDAWQVKKIIVDKNLTLIGPQSSFYGIYYGPIFYYSLVPFYFITAMDPTGGAYWAVFTGLIIMLILLYVAKEIYSYRTSLLAGIIYILSAKMNLFINRDCRNDPPLLAISLVIFWILVKIASSRKKINFLYLILLGILAGLGFHFHFASIVFMPLIFISFALIGTKRIIFKSFVVSLLYIIMLLPLILFDFLHQHMIWRSIASLLSGLGETGNSNYIAQLGQNIIIFLNNYLTFLIPQSAPSFIKAVTLFGVGLIFYQYWVKNCRQILKSLPDRLYILWIIVPVLVFSVYPGENYYYYYLLTVPVLLLVLARGMDLCFAQKNWRYATFFFLTLMALFNTGQVLTFENPRSLKLTEQAINYIKDDSQGKPVFIDYYSKDGFKVGFEYLTYYYNLNVVKPQNRRYYPEYLIYVPAGEIKNNYQAVFGDIGIVVKPSI